MIWFVLAVLIVIIGVTQVLRGSNLSHLDSEPLPPTKQSPCPAQREALRIIRDMNRAGKGLRGKARLNAIRDFMDSMSEGLNLTSEFRASQDESAFPRTIAPRSTQTLAFRLMVCVRLRIR